ncbi:MAG: hypothetical protein NTW25_15990 [Candidatus Kapabacteria bacterium]|nr:hypothetical protein [Candidatus Kapabacteria bacterium]
MKKSIYIVILFLAFFTLASLNAQDIKQVLIKGTVSDIQSKKPLLAVEIEFVDAQGNKTRTKSNEITGRFEQLLKANEKYTVVLLDDKILRENQEIETKGLEKYSEQNIDLTGKTLSIGMTIKSGNLFEPSTTSLSDEGIKMIEELKGIMRFNRSISVEIQVNARDTYSNENKDDDRLNKLVIGRVSAVEILVMKWGGLKAKVKMKHSREIEKKVNEKGDDVRVIITSVEAIK